MKILTLTDITENVIASNVTSILLNMFLLISMFLLFTIRRNLGSAVKAVKLFSFFNSFSLWDRHWLVEALPLHDERVAIHLSSMVDELLWVEVVLLELQLILQEVLLWHKLILLRCDHVRLVVQWLPFRLLIRLHTLLLPICHKWLLFFLCKNYWL